MVQWLRLRASTTGAMGSIPSWGAKIPHGSRPKNQNIKQKKYCNKFNKDFKNCPHQKKKMFLKFLGETYVDGPFGMGPGCENIYAPHICLIRATYMPINEVDRMIHPVDVIWALLPFTPVLPQRPWPKWPRQPGWNLRLHSATKTSPYPSQSDYCYC